MTNSFFHFRPFHVPWQNYAGDLAALLQTIGFTIAGFLGAIAIGLLVAVLRLAPWPPLRTIARIYTETFKNLPLVSEIFLVYFGLATIGIVLNVFVAGAISLAIFYGAYLSEIFRAGLQGVGRGQREAAQALGYDEARRFITRSGLLCAYRTDAAFEADRFGIELRRRRGVQLEVSARLVRTLADRFVEAGGEIVMQRCCTSKSRIANPPRSQPPPDFMSSID